MLGRILLALFAFRALAPAQAGPFQARAQKGRASGLSLGYRLFVPKGYDKSRKYPLVLALHGSGERGRDNVSQLTANRLATVWAEDSLQARVPHFVVAPQCPSESTWVRYNQALAGRPLSGTLAIVLEIVDSLGREFSLDPDRIYCVGLSMGGYATWELAERFPGRFAAIVPICGWADTSQAARIKDLPVWAFHGSADPTVPVAGSRDMIAALKRAGGNPRYTEYAGVGHDSWVPALQEETLPPWLFSQVRSPASALTRGPAAPRTPAGQGGRALGEDVRIDGRRFPAAGSGSAEP